MRDTADLRGARVLGGRHGRTRIGKIGAAVFHPLTYNLVGYLVKRPDLALIKARPDRFLAWDSLRIIEGKVVGYADRDAWDLAACKRLGLDFDTCLLLEGMPIAVAADDGSPVGGARAIAGDVVADEVAGDSRKAARGASEPGDGETVAAASAAASDRPPVSLGVVSSVVYDERSGKLALLKVSDGIAAKALLGTQDIPRNQLLGYYCQAIWVKPDAEDIGLSGGLAAKAGAGVARASDTVAKVASQAGAKVEQIATDAAIKAGQSVKRAAKQGSEKVKTRQAATSDKAAAAIDEGAKAVGRQLNASKGMFKAFKDEYRKAVGDQRKAGGKKR